MKSTLIELVGLAMVVAGLITVNPALLVAFIGGVLLAFGYRTGGIE
jgi:hypothetical protein